LDECSIRISSAVSAQMCGGGGCGTLHREGFAGGAVASRSACRMVESSIARNSAGQQRHRNSRWP
jgi:hypothetical protein